MRSALVVTNTAIVVIRTVVGMVLGLFLASYLARVLGPTNNGLYALAVLLPTTAVTMGGFGVSSATVFIIGGGLYSLSEVLAKQTFVGIALGFFAMAIGSVVIFYFRAKFFPGLQLNVLIIVLLIIPFIFVYTNLVATFQGLQDFRTLGFLTIIPSSVTYMLCLIGLQMTDDKLMTAVIFWGAGYLFALIAIVFLLRVELRNFFVSLWLPSSFFTDVFSFGIKIYLGNLVTFFNYRLNFYLLDMAVGSHALGIYAVTVPITEAIWLIANAVSNVIFPFVASHGVDGAKYNIVPVISRWVFFVSVLMGLVIFLLAQIIVDIAFGKEYTRAVGALYWLLPGVVFFTVTKVLSSDIAGRGRPEINLYLSFFSLVINLLANYVLLPKYGLNGAAMASSVTYCFYTAIISVVYSKLVGVHVFDCFIPNWSDWLVFKRIVLGIVSR